MGVQENHLVKDGSWISDLVEKSWKSLILDFIDRFL